MPIVLLPSERLQAQIRHVNVRKISYSGQVNLQNILYMLEPDFSLQDDGILKTPKVFCEQSDPRNYHQETIKNTSEALADLYSQVVAMPAHNPMRKQFLDDVSCLHMTGQLISFLCHLALPSC